MMKDVMISMAVTGFGEPLQRLDAELPEPQGTEILLEVEAAGVCRSDVHISDGHYDLGGGKRLQMADRGITLPLTMGHEIVGRIVRAGPEAEVEAGASRVVYPWIGCNRCATCAAGDEQLCAQPRFLGIFRPGGYATHALVPHPRYLEDLAGLTPAAAAPYACSGLTAYGALKKFPQSVLRDECILFVGAGGVGLMGINVLRLMGGKGAIVADIDAAKREAALEMGALAAFDPQEPGSVERIRELSPEGRGVNAVIDFVGVPSSFQLGIDCLAKRGKLVMVGLMGGEAALALPLLPSRSWTIEGSYVGSLQDFRELMTLVRTGDPLPMPTVERPLESAAATLRDLVHGRIVGRAVLSP